MLVERTGNSQSSGLPGQCLWLATVAAIAVLVLAGPAWLAAGEAGVRGLIVAFGLCLPPGCLAVCAAGLCRNVGLRLPVVVLAGMGLRLLAVTAGILGLRQAGGSLTLLNFTVWVVLAYLVMLAAETWLVLRLVQQEQQAEAAGAREAGVPELSGKQG